MATISAVVAPAGDVAALAPPAAAATITSEKDAPTVPDGSCSEDLYVDDENSNETSRALPGATTSFDGVSCDQGLNPHSLRGSADSLIDAVAATRAGIGALRYDTVVHYSSVMKFLHVFIVNSLCIRPSLLYSC